MNPTCGIGAHGHLETIVVTFASDRRKISFVYQNVLHGATLYESYGHLQFMDVSPPNRKLPFVHYPPHGAEVVRSAATVLATPMHAIGQQNALQPEFRSQYMQENKNVNNCSVYCTFQVLPRLLPESLSAVSGAPREAARVCMLFGRGASDTAT